jgi:hypothetical protein
VLLNDKERHCTNKRNGTHKAHDNLVRVNESLWGLVSNTGRDTDSDPIDHDNEAGTGNINKVVELRETLAFIEHRRGSCRAAESVCRQLTRGSERRRYGDWKTHFGALVRVKFRMLLGTVALVSVLDYGA